MRVGLDTYTIRELKLSAYKMIDYAEQQRLEGVQFGDMREISETLDVGALKDARAYADSKGLYTYVSVTHANPVMFRGSFDELKQRIEREITVAAACGWHELRGVINIGMERYNHPTPWPTHVDQCIMLINALRPALEKYGSRINIETHGETTFDILKVIECTSPHLVGVCLDTANTLVNAEDPVLAVKRVAPYTHMTHTKDGIITFCDEGIVRQGKPPGEGCVDFEAILPILGKYCPQLPLSIEDHKGLFKMKIYDREWLDKNPDITVYELGQFIKLARQTHKRLESGDLPPVEEYEAVPYLEQMERRLSSGRDYLNGLLQKLDLRG